MAMTQIVQRTCDIYGTRGAKTFNVMIQEVQQNTETGEWEDVGDPALNETRDFGKPGLDRAINFAKRGLAAPGADEQVPSEEVAKTSAQ